MKRSLLAALFAAVATVSYASNDQYRNEAGEQDVHPSIASNDQYRNEPGQQDEHAPQVG
jgi:hypothetical protein